MSRSILALLLLGLPASAAAAPLTLLNQGYLQDSNGDGLTGTQPLTFSLYDDAAATNAALWSEALSVEFTDGAYSVVLGTTSGSELSEELLDQNPLYLGLKVATNPEMTPRHELHSVPYSILSETAFNVNGGTVKATSVEGDEITAGGTVIDSDGISVGGTLVIGADGDYVGESPAPPDIGCEDGEALMWDASTTPPGWGCGTLASTETDPVFGASAASDITGAQISSWDDAYGWGDHGEAGYLQTSEFEGYAAADIVDSDLVKWDVENDPVFTAHPAAGISSEQIASWQAAASTDNFTQAEYTTWLSGVATGPTQWDAAASADNFTQAEYTSWLSGVATGPTQWDAAASADNFTQAEYTTWLSGVATGPTQWDAAASADNFTQAEYTTWLSGVATGPTQWDAAASADNFTQAEYTTWLSGVATGPTQWELTYDFWGMDGDIGAEDIITSGSIFAGDATIDGQTLDAVRIDSWDKAAASLPCSGITDLNDWFNDPNSGPAGILRTDIDFAHCGFADDGSLVVTTTLHGTSSHWKAVGANNVYDLGDNTRRVYVSQSDSNPGVISAANARTWNMRVHWTVTPVTMGAPQRTLFFDFEDENSAQGWSSGSLDGACFNAFGTGSFLGGYNQFGLDAQTSYKFDLRAHPHSQLMIEYDLLVIDSWDGETAALSVDGNLALTHGPYSGSGLPHICGDTRYGDLGLQSASVTIDHTADSATLSFSSTLDQGSDDESWGIDNVRVTPLP